MQLRLTLRVAVVHGNAHDPRVIVAEGLATNAGDRALTIDLVELASASLAVEIVDPRGAPVPMPPPPTPGPPEPVVLAPGEARTAVYRTTLPPDAKRGRYRARLRYRGAHSDWIAFDVH